MDVSTIAELVTAFTLVAGVVFAVVQLRHLSASRKREAALELLHSFQTVEFIKALRIVVGLPAGLSKKEIEERLGERMDYFNAFVVTWESIGVLVFRGEISLDLVDDFFGGFIVISWEVVKSVVEENRAKLWPRSGEWFQWLVERLMEHQSTSSPVPAHIKYRDWKPR